MVAPNMEASVSRALTSLNFDHWIFRIRRRAVHRGQIIERSAPAFPGYIFVYARNAWMTIKNIIGVCGFVRFCGQVQDVPLRVVEELLAQVDENGVLAWQLPEYEDAGFRFGETVSVFLSQGVTLQGQFQHLLSPDRAVIMLDWMGRAVPVSVKLSDCNRVIATTRRKRPGRKHRVAHMGGSPSGPCDTFGT